jgi:hypothetical protein
MPKISCHIEPIDGKFVHNESTRARQCAKSGHPLALLNLSLSGKVGREVRRCLCGEVNEGPAAIKESKRLKKEAKANG